MEHDYDTEKKLWKILIIEPEFKTLQKHMNDRIEYCRSILEEEDNADARAEIRVLRNILHNADKYRDEK